MGKKYKNSVFEGNGEGAGDVSVDDGGLSCSKLWRRRVKQGRDEDLDDGEARFLW